MGTDNIPNFADLEAKRQELEDSLQQSFSPEQKAALETIRSMESKKLQSDKKAADEALAQRVAQILAGKLGAAPRVHGTRLGEPARIVGHLRLQCKNCPENRAADHPGHAGGCHGDPQKSHDFYGMETRISDVDKLESHHAIHIDGTVAYPAN